MKNILFIFLISFGWSTYAKSPNTLNEIDSLNQLIYSEIHDTSRIKAFHHLAKIQEKESLDSAYQTSLKALDIAKKIDNGAYLCKSYNVLGSLSRKNGKGKQAIQYFDSVFYVLNSNKLDSLKYPKKVLFYQAGSMSGKAKVLSVNGKTKEALTLMLNAMKIWQSIDNRHNMTSTLVSLGVLFFRQGKYEDALNYYLQAVDLAKKEGNRNFQFTALTGAAVSYGAMGELDKAIEYFNEILAMGKETNDPALITAGLTNLSVAYQHKKDYKKALYYAMESKDVAEKSTNPRTIAFANNSIGSIYLKMEKYDQAIKYIHIAEKIAVEIGEKSLLKTLYEKIPEIYAKKGDHEKAYEYQKLLIAITDTLFNEKNNRQITEMKTKYETDQKEQENKLLKKESEVQELQINRQKTTIYFGTGGLVLILSLAGVVYRSYRQKKKANLKLMEKNAIIRAKTEDIHKKNLQITDSIDYAQRIQQAVLPSRQHIESIFQESFVFFKPKDRVSGDFYWIHQEENNVLFAAADCTGHGVPGAFMSLICTDLLNNIMLDGIFTPSIILEELGNRLVKHLKQKQETEDSNNIKDALDIALCNYNTKTKELVYSGAHNSLYLVRDNELKEYKADKLHIGIDRKENSEFTNHIIATQTDDIIYMFSDGFVDQQGGEKGKKFYYPPFRKLLLESHTKSMEEQKENLDTTISNWIGEREQIDDMLVFGVKFT